MKQLSRRSLLSASATLLAFPAFGAPTASSETEIVIVGAGAAGIAAARRLIAAGRRVIVIEAAERVGGRCITDTALFGVPFDLGAHWIYSPDINPLTKIARSGGLEIYPAPSGQRVRLGRRNAREGELEDFLTSLVRSNRAMTDATRGKADMSAAQALPRDLGDWKPAVEFVLGPYNCGVDLNEISAMDLGRSAERDSSAFCRQGFGALLASLAAKVPVQLATPATHIDTNRSGRVEVRTPKGTIGARYAIVTASTGVLNAGKIAFVPELPRRQLDALAKLKPGSFDHVALELPGNPLGLQRDDLVFEKPSGAQTGALLANVSGSELCLVEVGGRFGRELSTNGERAMVEFAMDWLTGLYGTDIRKAVRRTHATNWNQSPWVLGASAAAAPGAQPSRRIMMEPVRDRLFFAGEAVHETGWGTVGGAWESGERAAESVLRRMGVLKDPVEPKPSRQQQRRRKRDPA